MATVTEREKRRVGKRRPGSRSAADDATAATEASTLPQPRAAWYRSTFALAMYSAVLLFLSFPLSLAPLSWVARAFAAEAPAFLTSIQIALWPLAWLAPVFWLWLIREPQLAGRRPYRALWLAGFAYNLLVFHFLVLPHWSGVFGWLALSAYLGVYLPAFVGIARVAVHRLRVPLILAAPTVWVGLELIRGHAFTGISAALLGHTQVYWTSLIQIADAFGAYGVSLLLMFVAACIVDTLPSADREWRWWPGPLGACAVIAALAYGNYRLQQIPPGDADRAVRVAVVQGTVETVFDSTPEEARARMLGAFEQHRELTSRALRDFDGVQLIIWPESMFTATDLLDQRTAADDSTQSQENLSQRETVRYAQGLDPYSEERSPARMLVGTHTVRLTDDANHHHNSALLFDRDGAAAARYYKSHLVIFGEYVPLGNVLPWLYRFSPIGAGLTPGEQPLAFETGGLRFAPTICFESLVPHYVSRQIGRLQKQGASPDVLVNVTNDGWFHGSAGLDQHLASNMFRAVEQRRPMLVAANEGVSAYIDGTGRIVKALPRQREGIIVCDVRPDGRDGWYQHVGDLPAWCLAALTLLAVVAGVWLQRRGAATAEAKQPSV